MKLIRIVLLSLFCQCCFAQHWQSLGTGLNYAATCFFSDTVSDRLYVGGPFTRVNNDTVWGIASWNGNSWDSLGHGIGRFTNNFLPGNTWGMTHFGNDLYVGGNFKWTGNASSKYLSRWDGTNWNTIQGGQPNSAVLGIINYNNELYICGVFDSVGNVPANGIAKWNGTSWQAIGNNYTFVTPTDGNISEMQFYHGNLYIGGIFDDPSGNTCRLAKWDGTNWQFLTNDLRGSVAEAWDMKVYNDELYVSGLFYQAAGNAANCIMRWNDTTWRDVGGSVDFYSVSSPQVRDMRVHNGKLYCTGSFEIIGGIMAMGLASWDGTEWCGYNPDFETNNQFAGPFNLDFYHDTLYVGGGFRLVESDTVFNIAEWIGGNYVDTCGAINTGISEHATSSIELSIFPNPSNGMVSVTGEINAQDEIVFDVFNLLGQVVHEEKQSPVQMINRQIDLSSLADGVYMVQVRTGNKSFTQKIIIQK
jgi:hypothetical protein